MCLDIFCYVHYTFLVLCTWFSELSALLVRSKHLLLLRLSSCNLSVPGLSFVIIYGVMLAVGTRLLQKCLRYSPPGVVCTQVWNLKELTEGHHKNAWSMWLNLTQRGKSYQVQRYWGLTGCYEFFFSSENKYLY